MPNWATNTLTIEGSPELVARFIDENKTDESIFSFTKSVPTPDTVFQGNLGAKEREIYGSNNWYDWNIANWGTKWDATITDDEWFVYNEDRTAELNFETAWSPPVAWIEKASLVYPELVFAIQYEEEGMQFSGKVMANNGNLTKLEDEEFVSKYEYED